MNAKRMTGKGPNHRSGKTVRNQGLLQARRERQVRRRARRGIGALGIVALLGVGFLGFQMIGGMDLLGGGGGNGARASAGPLDQIGHAADGILGKIVGGIEGLWNSITGKKPTRGARPEPLPGPFPPDVQVVPVFIEAGPLPSTSPIAKASTSDTASPITPTSPEPAEDVEPTPARPDAPVTSVAPATKPNQQVGDGDAAEATDPGLEDLGELKAAAARAYRSLRASLTAGDIEAVDRARRALMEANKALAAAHQGLGD